MRSISNIKSHKTLSRGSFLLRTLLATTVLIGLAEISHAADGDGLYWDGSNMTPGGVSGGRGGDGTWDSANTNWTNADGTTNDVWTSTIANFGGTPGNVYVVGPKNIEGLTFSYTAFAPYTLLSGGAGTTLVTPVGTTIIQLGSGTTANDVTLFVPISGAGRVLVRGLGSVTFRSENTYTGGTRIEDGTVVTLRDDGTLGSGAVVIDDGGFLNIGRNGDPGITSINNSGYVVLYGPTTLGAAIVENTATGNLAFESVSDAGSGYIANFGSIFFADEAMGTNARIANGIGSSAVVDVSGMTDRPAEIGTLSGGGTLRVGLFGVTVGHLNESAVFSGVIEDAPGSPGLNGLTKVGTGTLILSGHNTSLGDTTAHEGRLVIDGSVAGDVRVNETGRLAGSGSIGGTVNVALGGILEGHSGQTLTMGELRLNGSLSDNSHLELHLGAPNSSALFNVIGDLRLDGMFVVADTGGFGNGVYRIIDYGGTLTDNGVDFVITPAGTTATVQTSIASQVNLVVSGGTVDPGPIPTIQFWNGTTTVPTGTVAGGSGAWTSGGAANWTDANGTRSDPWNDNFAVFQGAAGVVTVDTAGVSTTGMQFAVDGYRVEGGDIALSGPATIRVGDGSAAGAGYAATIASAITGSGGLVKNDLGTLILSGDSSLYAGSVTVAAGDLRVGAGGSLGTTLLTVDAAGTLSGLGTIIGDVSVAGGRLAPGAGALGALTVQGNVAFDANSTFVVRIAADGSNDALAATTADLDGQVAVTAIDAHTSYVDGQDYTILTTDANGVSGTFDGATMTTHSAFLTPTLTYNADNVVLTIAVTQDFSTVAETYNQLQAANALNDLEQTGDALAVFNTIANMNADDARRAFDLTSGEIHAAGQHVIDQTFALFNRTLRYQGVAGIGSGNVGAQTFTAPLGYGPAVAAGNSGVVAIGDVASQADARVRGAWAAPLGGFGHIDGDGNAAQLDWWNAGLAGGYEGVIDVASGAAVGGFGFGYIHSGGTLDDRLSTFDADGFYLGAYGAWTDGPWNLAGSLSYGANRVSTERNIAFMGTTAEASYWTHTIGASGEASYAFDIADTTKIAPLFTLDAGWSGHGGFTETGAGALNLTSGSESWARLDAGLGIALTHTILTETGNVTLEGRAVWEHAFADVVPNQSLALAGSPTGFSVLGPDAGRDRLRIGAGLSWDISDDMTVRARYDGLFSGDQANHSASLGLNVRF